MKGWSQRRNSCDGAALLGHGFRFEKLCTFCQLVGWPSHYMERGRKVLRGEYLFLVRKEGRDVLAEAIVQRRTSLILSGVLAISKHSINNLTLNFIMNNINPIDELKLYKTLDAAITKSHDIQSDVNGLNVSKETINTGFAALNIIMDDIRPIDELKLSETLDTATTKIHDIQNDVNEPNVSKETINTAFTALTKIIEEIRTDLAK